MRRRQQLDEGRARHVRDDRRAERIAPVLDACRIGVAMQPKRWSAPLEQPSVTGVPQVIRIRDGVTDAAWRGMADDQDRSAVPSSEQASLGAEHVEPCSELIALGVVLTEARPLERHDGDAGDIDEAATAHRNRYPL